LYFILIILFYKKGLGRNITLNAVAFTFDSNDILYSKCLNKFNDYARKNNLNIEAKLNLMSNDNSSSEIKDYGSMVETAIKKTKNLKYHIYFYDNVYVSKYGPHLLNIREYLPKEHIIYDSKLLDCTYNNRLVG